MNEAANEPKRAEPTDETALAEAAPLFPPASIVLRVGALAIAAAAIAYFLYGLGHWVLFNVYRHLFDVARLPYHFDFNDIAANIDWPALAIAAGAAVALALAGYLVLQGLDLFIPRLAGLALAYVVGLGLVGVLLEVETIFALHSRWSILITYFAAVLLAAIVAQARGLRKVKSGSAPDWATWRVHVREEHAGRYWDSLVHPAGAASLAYYLLLLLIAAVTLLTFYHGSLFPVTYWDSLILYVGWAREIFFEHKFPFRAAAQVGIGLGANYPHLYLLITAATATVAGRWSDSFAQVASPLAGLFSCFLIYHTALRLTRHRLLSMAVTAIFRTVPYGIAYFIYASDYSFVMLFAAAFLYVALLYLSTNLGGYFILATLIAAFGMHINYLMGLLWILWAAMIVLAHFRPYREPAVEKLEILEETDLPRDVVQLQTEHPTPPTLWRFLASGKFWTWLFIGVALASPWYIRNWVLAGNPVYAFFPKIFPKTVHYNPEVMASAEVEWTMNGDGIGKPALTREFWEDFDRFKRARDVSKRPIARLDEPLARKIEMTRLWLVTDWNAWKLSPSLIGIALPGLLIFALRARRARHRAGADRETIAIRRFGWLCVLFLLLLLGYHYFLASYYLYQIIAIVVLIPILGVFVVRALATRFEQALFVVLALVMAIAPGLPMALMGFKIKSSVKMGDRVYSPFELVALHNPGMDTGLFRELAFGPDMFNFLMLNTVGVEEKTLTHENRLLMIDRRSKIVHLDDWDVQQLYGKPPAEQLAALRKMGIRYYLFVPNEANHQVNRRLGPPARSDIIEENAPPWKFSALRGWIEDGTLQLVMEEGPNRLYEFRRQ